MAAALRIKVGETCGTIFIEIHARGKSEARLIFAVRAKIIVGTVSDAFNLLRTKRGVVIHQVVRTLRVVGKLISRYIVDRDPLAGNTDTLPPGQTILKPALMPGFIGTGDHEELDLHLLEFAYAEEEVARIDLIAERLPNLSNPKRELPTGCGKHISEVDKDTLSSLGAQVGERTALGHWTNLGTEHHVEGAWFSQIGRATTRTATMDVISTPAHLTATTIN